MNVVTKALALLMKKMHDHEVEQARLACSQLPEEGRLDSSEPPAAAPLSGRRIFGRERSTNEPAAESRRGLGSRVRGRWHLGLIPE